MMRRYNLLFLFAFILSGCQSEPVSYSDVFVSFKPRIAPDALSGIWTGKTGSDIWTLKVNNDGTGVSCYSYQGRDGADNIKYDGLNFLVENDVTINVKTYNEAQLIVTTPNNADIGYMFVKDDGRELMSAFCFNYFAIW